MKRETDLADLTVDRAVDPIARMHQELDEVMQRAITSAQAGKILQLEPDSVRRLARQGKLPIIATVGRGVRLFDRQGVEQLAVERRAHEHGGR